MSTQTLYPLSKISNAALEHSLITESQLLHTLIAIIVSFTHVTGHYYLKHALIDGVIIGTFSLYGH